MNANQPPTTPTLRLERIYDCTPEEMWSAWVEPAQLAKWISPFPGLDAEVHELDARVGGRIRFTMVDAQGNRYVEDEGVFEVLDRPREIVQFQPNEKRDDIFRGHPQRMRALIEPVAGGTRLILEVYGLPPQIPPDAAAQGFGSCLEKLRAVVAPKGASA